MSALNSTVSPVGIALLAGGDSIRMGSPKYLLPDADGTPCYLSRLKMLRQAFPEVQHLCLLLRDQIQQRSTWIPPELDVQVLCVEDSVKESHQRGPAMTVFSAFNFDRACYWLTIPCDYPLLGTPELIHLLSHYRDPVTCFKNGQGSTEPLVAIWSPKALSHLAREALCTRDHLTDLVERLKGTTIFPIYDHSLFNANTREDWEDAIQLLSQSRNVPSADNPPERGLAQDKASG